ncbi:hypothetical protein IAU60_000806 [Kwoniella sp. DSM 27419]
MAPTATTKKAAAPKKAAASHPTFLAMIQEAVKANPDGSRKGASRPAIKKYLADTYKIDMSSASNVNNLSNAIKRGEEKKELVLPSGISGRVKLAPKAKPAGKENVAPKKAAAPAKKPAATATKKAAPAAKKATPAAKPAAKKAAPAAKKAAPAAKKTVTATKKAPAAKAAAGAKKAPAKKAAAPKKAATKKA